MLDENAAFNPVTAYGSTKVLVEADLALLADDTFSPTYMRNATGHGMSPRLRADIVVNNLVRVVYLTGEIVVHSDGTPWRPLVHVQDISQAFLAVFRGAARGRPQSGVQRGYSSENYQIRDVAEIVQQVVPGSTIRYLEGRGPIRPATVWIAENCHE